MTRASSTAGLALLLVAAVATTTYAQVNCLVDTGSGKIDLTQIPQKALVMTQTYQGTNTDHVFKFNLCNASGEPPQGAENCNKNVYAGEWGTNGGCEAQFDSVTQQPMYNNGAVMIGYYNQNGWTATITLKCGGTPLDSGGAVAVSEQLQFAFQLTSQYVCGGPPPTETPKPTKPPKCNVGPFDLSPIPSKAFPVKVVDANGSSTLHVVQLSLCAASDQPPRGADKCYVAAYYGEWSSMGACEAQFNAVASPNEFNGTHAILYFGNEISSQRSTVYLGCGTKDLDVISVTRNSRGDLFTTATSKYACSTTCTVQTPRGIVDLSVIPETVLTIWDSAEGRRFGSSLYRFSLCQLSIVPPSDSEFCGKSYVGRWPTTGKCIFEYQYDKGRALPYDGNITIAYASTQHDNTLTVGIQCGNATLAAAGDAIHQNSHSQVLLSSKYACVQFAV